MRRLVRVLALEESRGMLRSSDLKEWMAMSVVGFAFLTEIIIRTNRALVPYASNRSNLAVVTSNMRMNLSSLVGSLLSKVVNHQSLEGLSGIGLNLFLDDLNKITIDLVLESARA